MHRLSRQVRFSVNPLSPEQDGGGNLSATKLELAIFLQLSIELTGEVDSKTGFVVNVSEIDGNVRRFGLPYIIKKIKAGFKQDKFVELHSFSEMLRSAWEQLADKFGQAQLSELSLELDPLRKLTVNSKELTMVYFGEKFDFAAGHKLWNAQLSEQQNFEVFGKCANPTGHGHNYTVEVTVKIPADEKDFRTGDFEKTVEEQLIKVLDHKNLNQDVIEFRETNPTVENIASFAWNNLAGKINGAMLYCVTVWETDRTRCSFYG